MIGSGQNQNLLFLTWAVVDRLKHIIAHVSVRWNIHLQQIENCIMDDSGKLDVDQNRASFGENSV